MISLPWHRLAFFSVASFCVAYPATLALYTWYLVSGVNAAFSLCLLVNPVVFFLFALWYFRETGASSGFAAHAVSAAVWTLIVTGISLALYQFVYARSITEQLQSGPMLGHVFEFGAILLAGFISRPRAAGPPL